MGYGIIVVGLLGPSPVAGIFLVSVHQAQYFEHLSFPESTENTLHLALNLDPKPKTSDPKPSLPSKPQASKAYSHPGVDRM